MQSGNKKRQRAKPLVVGVKHSITQVTSLDSSFLLQQLATIYQDTLGIRFSWSANFIRSFLHVVVKTHNSLILHFFNTLILCTLAFHNCLAIGRKYLLPTGSFLGKMTFGFTYKNTGVRVYEIIYIELAISMTLTYHEAVFLLLSQLPGRDQDEISNENATRPFKKWSNTQAKTESINL